MGFKITGLDKLQRQLDEAQRAFTLLDGELAQVSFDPSDVASVEMAIAEGEAAIDDKVGAYRSNPMVAPVIAQMKEKFRANIRQRAAEADLERGGQQEGERNVVTSINASIFNDIDNAIRDLRASEHQTYERPLKRLAKLIHDPGIEPIRAELVAKVDWDGFLSASDATGGSMVGSHRLVWPDEPELQFGLTLILIDKMAEDTDWAIQFTHHYFYSSTKIVSGLHSIATQVLMPFARDFKAYVMARTPAQPMPHPVGHARKIFIVHGHDEAAREGLARFCENIGFEAIILHEQASRGMTVAEKLREYGDVGFAVVLLTPDDVGRAVKETDLRPRARQNVLLELGYFVGRLGADRVCALMRGAVEIPSDYVGVVYTEFDQAGAWKNKLGLELQAAGFEIDWNKVMKR